MPGKPVTLKPPRKMIIVINCIILYYYILKHFFTLSDFISDRYIMSFLRACDPQALPSIDMYFGPPLSIYSIVSTVENAVFRPGSQWQSRAASLCPAAWWQKVVRHFTQECCPNSTACCLIRLRCRMRYHQHEH